MFVSVTLLCWWTGTWTHYHHYTGLIITCTTFIRKRVRQTEPTSFAVICSPCFFWQPASFASNLLALWMFASFDWQKSISIWFDFEGHVAPALKEILSIYLKRAEYPLISEERNLSKYYCALTISKYPSEKADLFTSSDLLTVIHFPLYRVPLFILIGGNLRLFQVY